MSTQSFDLPCSFSRRDSPRVSLSLEKPAETRGSCSLRYPITHSSPSIVAQAAPRGRRREEIVEGRLSQRARSLKRFHERSTSSSEDRAKRTRIGSTEFLFPQSIEEPPLVKGEVCFIPSAAICPLVTSSTNAAIESFGAEEEFGTGEGTNCEIHCDAGSSSGIHSSSPEQDEDFSDNETWDGAPICFPSAVRGWGEITQTENQGLDLVSLLLSCAESISSGDNAAISYFLARLGELASPTGAPIHRVIAYFTESLALRAVKLWPHTFSIAPPRELADQINDDDAIAFQVLNHASPIPKFLHFTLNERLLRVFEGKDRVHIIDFDIKQGLQWPGLLQSLASRPQPPSHVRITGIGESKQDLQDIGSRLAGLADSLSLPFEFHPVVDGLEDVRLWMLHVKEGECVAVNCVLQLHKVLYDETGRALMDLLGLVRSTNPEIVLLAEQEAEHNDPRWEARLAYSLKFYSAIFDSLDSSLEEESLARIKVEEMFGREIRNVVACEGRERVERHENFNKWRELMEGSGFRSAGIGERETVQSRLVLRMYSDQDYSIERQGEDGDGDGLTLKWSDQPLYTVSAWAPVDIAGSSTTSQPC